MFSFPERNSSRVLPVTCFSFVAGIYLPTIRLGRGLCEIWPSSQSLLVLCILSARAMLRKHPHVSCGTSDSWQLFQKLTCQLCPCWNHPKGYWLHKQTILFLSKVTVYSGSQISLSSRMTWSNFKNPCAQPHPTPFKYESLRTNPGLSVLKSPSVISMCHQA